VKFSRGRSGGRHTAEDPGNTGRLADADESAAEAGPGQDGPYDSADAPSGVQRLDFGSIEVPLVPDVQIQAQDNGAGGVAQIILTHETSALLLVACAAPRSESVWDEVRSEVRESMTGDGVPAEELEGAWGTQLKARLQSPDGVVDLRFLGVDGPRWMLQGVLQGTAAADLDYDGPLLDAFRGLVVNRGPEAMPVREGLPLNYPREHLEAMRAAQAAQAGEGAGGVAGSDDHTPVEGASSPRPRRSE